MIFFYLHFLAETDPHDGKRKVEALWPVFRIHHQRSRYIYDLFYRRKAISRGWYFGGGGGGCIVQVNLILTVSFGSMEIDHVIMRLDRAK